MTGCLKSPALVVFFCTILVAKTYKGYDSAERMQTCLIRQSRFNDTL